MAVAALSAIAHASSELKFLFSPPFFFSKKKGGPLTREKNNSEDLMEILSPAGSPEALRAAVCAGADAVYLGFGQFNARRGAKNFTRDEFAAAVSYCHLRGVKVYLTLNTLCSDREMAQAVDCAAQASRMGVELTLNFR